MPILPKKGEKKKEFVSRCIGEEVRSGMPQKQAIAVCFSKSKQKRKKK